jgi:hypothetical protein
MLIIIASFSELSLCFRHVWLLALNYVEGHRTSIWIVLVTVPIQGNGQGVVLNDGDNLHKEEVVV